MPNQPCEDIANSSLVIINEHKHEVDPEAINALIAVNGHYIVPSRVVKLLGEYTDDHLSFSTNVHHIISRTNPRLYFRVNWMSLSWTMKVCRLSTLNIRTILIYTYPALYYVVE